MLLNLIPVAYSQTRNAAKSLAVLEQAAELAPEYYPPDLDLAVAYDDLGDAEKALDFLDWAIEVHPPSASLMNTGVVLMRKGRRCWPWPAGPGCPQRPPWLDRLEAWSCDVAVMLQLRGREAEQCEFNLSW